MQAKLAVPQIIREVGLDISWDERKVWDLDFPTESISITELVWHFDIPFWSKPGGFYNLTPQEVLSNPGEYSEEYTRTMQADTSHPIDIMFWRGQWLILDGLHSLLKQVTQGKENVQVRKIPVSEKSKIISNLSTMRQKVLQPSCWHR